jgi:hypothetical protein
MSTYGKVSRIYILIYFQPKKTAKQLKSTIIDPDKGSMARKEGDRETKVSNIKLQII